MKWHLVELYILVIHESETQAVLGLLRQETVELKDWPYTVL